MTTSNKITATLRDSAAMRWTALLLLASAMFFSYIFMDILSPIKDLMQSTRGWDSTAFGTMQGSETFLNVFVFFLIFYVWQIFLRIFFQGFFVYFSRTNAYTSYKVI